MIKATILFADNDTDFRRTRSEFLERDGYRVLQAGSPAEARRLLDKNGIDLAILDLRLENDHDDKDTSGLTIAQELAPSIPKILLTKFQTIPKTVIEARRPQLSGLPAAVDFVEMSDGAAALTTSVRLAIALHVERRVRNILFDVSTELEQYFGEARKQAAYTNRVKLVMIVTGLILIVVGGLFLIAGISGEIWEQTAMGSVSVVSGVVAEIFAGLLKKMSDDANKRMDRCHRELLGLYKEYQHFGKNQSEVK